MQLCLARDILPVVIVFCVQQEIQILCTSVLAFVFSEPTFLVLGSICQPYRLYSCSSLRSNVTDSGWLVTDAVRSTDAVDAIDGACAESSLLQEAMLR